MLLIGAAGVLVGVLLVLLLALAWRLRAVRTSEIRTRARLAALLADDGAGLAVWDAGGRLVACNERFREFFPAVTLKPGLEFEDLVRYTATRAVVVLPEAEIDAWIAGRLERRGESAAETLRTPDGRWLEIRTRPTEQGETLLVLADVTEARTAASAPAIPESSSSGPAAVALLQEAMALGREAVSFHQAVRELTRRLAEWGGWDAGSAYLAPADGSGALVSTGVWHVGDGRAVSAETRAALDACCGDAEDHVLRRAVSGESTWVANVAVDPRLSDARRAALGPLRSVHAVPVASRGQVVAVIELFAAAPAAPDPPRERIAAAAAGELAHVFERERTALTSGDEPGASLPHSTPAAQPEEAAPTSGAEEGVAGRAG